MSRRPSRALHRPGACSPSSQICRRVTRQAQRAADTDWRGLPSARLGEPVSGGISNTSSPGREGVLARAGARAGHGYDRLIALCTHGQVYRILARGEEVQVRAIYQVLAWSSARSSGASVAGTATSA